MPSRIPSGAQRTRRRTEILAWDARRYATAALVLSLVTFALQLAVPEARSRTLVCLPCVPLVLGALPHASLAWLRHELSERLRVLWASLVLALCAGCMLAGTRMLLPAAFTDPALTLIALTCVVLTALIAHACLRSEGPRRSEVLAGA